MNYNYQTYRTRLYRGVARNIATRYGSCGLKFLKWSQKLKSIFTYSYISNYECRILSIAKYLGWDSRTLQNRIKKLIAHQFAYMEGTTLRLASDTQIKKHFATKTRSRYTFKWIEPELIDQAIDSQSISENIRKQKQAIAMKKREGSMKKLAECQSSFQTTIKITPNATLEIVDTTLMSQRKAAQLNGYKSKTSGYRLLKRLSIAGCLEIESNTVEITKEEYNRFKNANNTKVMIKGRGLDAKFYYLNANTVNLKNKPKQKARGVPYYLNDNW